MAAEITDIDRVIESRLRQANICFQCGACGSICPFSTPVGFNPRKLMLKAQLEPEEVLSSEQLWVCSSCNACVARCPMEVKPPEVFASLRSRAVENSNVPQHVAKALFAVFKGTDRYGNPWGKPRSERAKWAAALNIGRPTENTEVLYDVGCAASYDPRAQKIAQSMVRVLIHAGVPFSILGEEENCCGSCIRRLGEEGLFQMLVDANTELWHKYKIKKIVTGSPHCYNTFKNEYPSGPWEVQHYVQFIAELLQARRLSFAEGPPITVTYHDPCFLGRHNKIYDAPRQIIRAMPGVTLIEMKDCRESALCCGGGGGKMWVEPIKDEQARLAETRLKQAIDTGADLVVTACQFCMVNLQEATKVVGSQIQVKDLIELVSERLSQAHIAG